VQIAGTVKTAEGVPVPGATVRAVASESGKTWLTWTDDTGKFEFAELPGGHYRVEVEQLGFETVSREADFSSANASPLELMMRVGTGEASAAAAANGGAKTPASAPGAAAGQGAGNAQGNHGPQQGTGGRGQGQGGPAVPAGVVNAMRQGMGGFQQVDVNGETPQNGQTQGQNRGNGATGELAVSNVLGGGLGSAASSDAFLMNGTVGRGATVGEGGFSMAGPGGPGRAGRAARAAELFQGRVAADRAVDPAVQAGSAGPWAAAGRVEVEEDSGADDQEAAAKVKGSADSGAHNESCASR